MTICADIMVIVCCVPDHAEPTEIVSPRGAK